MNIAFFTDTFLPNTDGVVRAITALRKEFESQGHKVYIFCPGSKKQKNENKDPNVYHFTSAVFKPYPDYRIALFPFLSAIRRTKELNIDLIHSHGIATTGIAAIQCSKKLKIPCIATFHTLAPQGVHYLTKNEKLQDFFRSVAWKYLKWYYSNFDQVIVPSQHIKKMLQEHDLKKITVIPQGIDAELFSKKPKNYTVRKKYSIEKSPIILYVGRIAQEKNLELIIDSADGILNLYPEAKFLIVGKGPAKEHYENLVHSKGLSSSFIFTGFVPDSELPGYYQESDVFAFPSDFDTQGLVVMEALASGIPVVVKAKSAPSEFIKDSVNGYVFSDHFDFSQKIIMAIKNNEILKSNLQKEKSIYSMQNSAEQTLNLYKSILSSL